MNEVVYDDPIRIGSGLMHPSESWLDRSRYDMETAQAMLSSHRYLYVLFCCQQAAEKALKALIVRRTGEFPPRLHNLLRLAEIAGLMEDSPQSDFLAELSAYYIQTRYPDEPSFADSGATIELAADTLKRTEGLLEWLNSLPK